MPGIANKLVSTSNSLNTASDFDNKLKNSSDEKKLLGSKKIKRLTVSFEHKLAKTFGKDARAHARKSVSQALNKKPNTNIKSEVKIVGNPPEFKSTVKFSAPEQAVREIFKEGKISKNDFQKLFMAVTTYLDPAIPFLSLEYHKIIVRFESELTEKLTKEDMATLQQSIATKSNEYENNQKENDVSDAALDADLDAALNNLDLLGEQPLENSTDKPLVATSPQFAIFTPAPEPSHYSLTDLPAPQQAVFKAEKETPELASAFMKMKIQSVNLGPDDLASKKLKLPE